MQFSGRPVGLTTLASALSEDPDTLEDVYEPFLMQQGLMVRTPKGRQATEPRLRASGHCRHPRPDGRGGQRRPCWRRARREADGAPAR